MSRWIALLAIAALLFAGCGSRLDDDERAQLISALERRSASGADEIALSVDSGSTDSATAEGADEPSVTEARAAQEAASAAAPAGCAATSGSGTGLSDNKIVLATIADVSGIQPGIFQGVHRGASAAAAYINNQGGICGRQIETLLLDDHTDAGGNRAAMLDACANAFAVLGSLSAFDDASARPGEDCGIPDMTAITTNAAKYEAKNTFPVFPSSPKAVSTTNARYIAKRFPQAAKKAAMLYLDIAVGKAAFDARKAAWESEGFEFVYTAPVPLLEANYTRYVIEMRNRGVQYAHLIGDFQNMVRMQKTMRQQNYVPQVRDFDSITYDPDYLREPDVVKGSLTFLNTAPFEESSTEMNLYKDWYRRTAPGHIPDYFGLYAWSAYRLFQKIASEVSDLTRPKIIEALRATKTWDGHGLHGPQQIGAKLPTTCNVYLKANGTKFSRVHPASGFDCNGKVFTR